MKKLLLSLLVVAMAAGVSLAQEQGQFRARAGLAFGSKAGVDFDDASSKLGVGINIGAEYFFTDAISAAPSYTFFFPSKEGDLSIKPSIFNLDGRYYFGDGDISFYGLAGIAFQAVKADYGDISATGNATTFNIGGGVSLPIADMLNFNGQLKIMGGDDTETFDGPQVVLNAGISYSFN